MRISGRDGEELASQFDNTPPEPESRLEAVPKQYSTLNGVETYVDFVQKGQTVKYSVKQPRRMYSDVAQERANQLTTLPNHQSFVRVMTKQTIDGRVVNHENLIDFRVNLDQVNRKISDTEKERRKDISDRIRAQSKELGTDRRLLEDKLRERIKKGSQKNSLAIDGY